MIEIVLFLLLCICLYDLYTISIQIKEQTEELKIHSRRIRNLEGQVSADESNPS